MPEPKSVPPLDGPDNTGHDTPDHTRQEHRDKDHHQGEKEKPTGLPGQKIAPDGKKLPLSE